MHQVKLDYKVSETFVYLFCIFYYYYYFFRSEEQAIFEDVFIAKDEDVTRFVDYIHKTSKHVTLQMIRVYTGQNLPLTEEVV